MKKFLLLLVSFIAFAWSDSGYGSTGYGETGYESIDDMSVDSTPADPAPAVVKPAATAPAASTPAPAAEAPAPATTSYAPPKINSPFKKYGARLDISLSYVLLPFENTISPIGLEFDIGFRKRVGGDLAFLEFGGALSTVGVYYKYEHREEYDYYNPGYYSYYGGYYGGYYETMYDVQERQCGWLQVALDAQVLPGLDFGYVVVRAGAYAGYVSDIVPNKEFEDPSGYGAPLNEVAHNYRYGLLSELGVRISDGLELSLKVRYDMSDFSDENDGFVAVGGNAGILF